MMDRKFKSSWAAIPILALGLLWHVSAAGAQDQVDIACGPLARQKLDIHWPGSPGRGFSMVIFIHGGSLESGDKADEDYAAVWKPFPPAGIACATVNYSLSSDAPWPAMPEDCAAAVAWIRKAVADRGGDPKRIFLLGHSSGAMLAALLATDAKYLEAQAMQPRDLGGVIAMGSIMWDEEFEATAAKMPADKLKEALDKQPLYRMFGTPQAYIGFWPMKHVNAAMPPFLFLIAEAEQEAPPVLKHAKAFCEAARKLGVHADWLVLKDRTHYSAIRRFSEPGDPTFEAVKKFVFQNAKSIINVTRSSLIFRIDPNTRCVYSAWMATLTADQLPT
jgi:arylformamidase